MSTALPSHCVGYQTNLTPTLKCWTEWDYYEISRVVTDIKNELNQSQAGGFVIKIGNSISNNYEITKYDQNQRYSPKASLIEPTRCSQKKCNLCKSENSIRLPSPSFPEGFRLVRSLRNRPLIIDNNRSYNWLEMDTDSQIKMIQCAQKIFHLTKELNGINKHGSFLELHCGRAGLQTEGHTHLRINNLGIANNNPAKDTWNNIFKKLDGKEHQKTIPAPSKQQNIWQRIVELLKSLISFFIK